MQLGKYRLVKCIGRGGMGEVWEGTLAGEHGFTRRVAIKRMLGAHPDGFDQRFMDEARIASRLHHANIVSVLDFGVEDGAPFQVLELIDGIDAQRLYERSGGVPLEIALHLCIEVAHGLASAHALHIVHRDVSLENVLVSWEGDVKLSDFGVAKARDGAALTAGGVVGKPRYMAPEQATGGSVDGRTDVFALGCVLHALLTGATPLSGEDRLAELLAGKPLPIDAAIPAGVAAVIAKAVSRSKGDRFASADRMAESLAGLRQGRDGRLALRDFLAPLKPKKAGGALDALLAPQTESRSGSSALAPTFTPNTAARAPRAWPWVLAVLAGTAAGLSAAYLYATRPAAALPLPVVTVQPVVPRVPAMPVEEPPKPEPAPPPLAVAPPPGRPRAASAKEPKALGVLVVGGAAAQRAEILVDGKSLGFAPKRVELTVGAHEVVLVTPSGQRLGPKKVELTARHTDLDPARLLVDAP
ncbi:MAG: serine/threonine protein kinase [Archangiaceae bacterium]|nr:serine/threonine protein kinase [Archangiaceae bacterium]